MVIVKSNPDADANHTLLLLLLLISSIASECRMCRCQQSKLQCWIQP